MSEANRIPIYEKGPRPFLGLSDLGDHVLRCSNCRRQLAVVKVVRSDKQVRYVRASCPYGCRCSDGTPDGSFVHEVKGMAVIRPFGESRDDVGNEDELRVKFVDCVESEEHGQTIFTYVTEKA